MVRPVRGFALSVGQSGSKGKVVILGFLCIVFSSTYRAEKVGPVVLRFVHLIFSGAHLI